MADTNFTGMIIAVAIFTFFAIGGALLVNTGFNNYNINDNNDLDKYVNSSMKEDLNNLAGDLEEKDANAIPKATDFVLNPFGAIGKVISAMKSIRN